jgi:NAD(P)-dependent dehydrogenase (short-subunit alcohol dehydrogenase family)
MESNNWKNKNVVVTGGTSGLGRALALQLEAAGARVVIIARTQNNIDALVKENSKIIGIQGDISQKEQIYPLAGQIHSRLGDVDALFNVASDLGPTPLRLLVDTECENFEQVLQTNLLGPFRLTKALLPSMLLKRQGLVVNISSDAAINPYPKWGAYGTSKAAVDHLSRIFNEELKDQGIRFLSIDPGDMNTPMHFAAIPDADPNHLRDPKDSAGRILDLIAKEDFSSVRRTV